MGRLRGPGRDCGASGTAGIQQRSPGRETRHGDGGALGAGREAARAGPPGRLLRPAAPRCGPRGPGKSGSQAASSQNLRWEPSALPARNLGLRPPPTLVSDASRLLRAPPGTLPGAPLSHLVPSRGDIRRRLTPPSLLTDPQDPSWNPFRALPEPPPYRPAPSPPPRPAAPNLPLS